MLAEMTKTTKQGERVNGRKSFLAHDPEILRQWPLIIQLQFPYVLTAKSGVTKQLLDSMQAYLMQPNTTIAGAVLLSLD